MKAQNMAIFHFSVWTQEKFHLKQFTRRWYLCAQVCRRCIHKLKQKVNRSRMRVSIACPFLEDFWYDQRNTLRFSLNLIRSNFWTRAWAKSMLSLQIHINIASGKQLHSLLLVYSGRATLCNQAFHLINCFWMNCCVGVNLAGARGRGTICTDGWTF